MAEGELVSHAPLTSDPDFHLSWTLNMCTNNNQYSHVVLEHVSLQSGTATVAAGNAFYPKLLAETLY